MPTSNTPPTPEDLAYHLQSIVTEMEAGPGQCETVSKMWLAGLLRRCIHAEAIIDRVIRHASCDGDGDIPPADREALLLSWVDGHEKMVNAIAAERDAALARLEKMT